VARARHEFDELAPTGWAVLGLLSFGNELTGYELKKWADNSLRFFYWAPATSQIYAELKRLERLGYVTSREAAHDELRNKRVYRITTAGRDALRRWLRDAPVEPPVLKHGVALRVWLGHLVEPDELRSIVEQHRQYAEEMQDELERAAATARRDPAWTYPAAVIRWGARYYEAERALADETLRELTAIARANGRRKARRVRSA